MGQETEAMPMLLAPRWSREVLSPGTFPLGPGGLLMVPAGHPGGVYLFVSRPPEVASYRGCFRHCAR